ncbi:radical SAM superfamily protein [Anaerotignum neopropionicum]|uniref:Radical SAM superfamily protein n=1 Tax=Anaerotignum neopropionicum TaxID=36847 RepID=A0A136WDU2_9FIRM|nr:radical SAM protein [Anaerotignum neopropionicum]KXL52685.1 radical SAM superfamily protein [Anaerotignum neopropionicum]
MKACIPIRCNTACTYVKGGFPYHWDLNVYRGCTHDCKYCYARYSHRYLQEKGEFAGDIFVKTNIAEALERQLRNPKWDKSVINLGGVTDSYQEAEAVEKQMPAILRLMIRYNNPIIISTKSDLILRDFDLIDELSQKTYVNIASTVTTANEDLQRKLEPGAVSPKRRFMMLKEFGKTKASTGVHMMPLLPYLTDGEGNLNGVFSQAKDAGVDYLLPGLLYLRGETKQVFYQFLQKEYPNLIAEYRKLYQNGGLKEYRKPLYEKLGIIREKYQVFADYKSRLNREVFGKNEPVQLSLFD